jgi:hypothetical protein
MALRLSEIPEHAAPHALRLPYIDRTVLAKLPEGIAFDEQKVSLGNDAKGT